MMPAAGAFTAVSAARAESVGRFETCQYLARDNGISALDENLCNFQTLTPRPHQYFVCRYNDPVTSSASAKQLRFDLTTVTAGAKVLSASAAQSDVISVKGARTNRARGLSSA